MRNTRRAILLLIMGALLLPMGSLAKQQQYHSIAQVREQAKGAWRQTYAAHGRAIVVDVVPQVPSVDVFPMAEMKRAPLPIALPQEPDWSIHPTTKKGMEEDPSYFAYTFGDDGSATPAAIGGKKVKYGPHRIYYGDVFEPEGRYIPGSGVTFSEISELLRQALQKIGLPEDIIDPERPTSLNAHAYYGGSAAEFLAPGWGFISYEQRLRGIPIYSRGLPAATDYENPSPSAHFGFNFHTPQDYNLGGYLLTESRLLAEDVPLASFDMVKQSLEEEVMTGRLRHIFELRLCYAMAYPPGYAQQEYYPNKDIPGYTVPVWAADVLWTDNPGKELAPAWEEPGGYEAPDPRNTFSYRRLMVNAQTGKLYDPQSRDRNRGFYEGYLSWEDAGGL